MESKATTFKPSTIETIDMAIFDLINDQFDLHTNTNSGFKKVPVLWVSPERAFNSKEKDIRDSVGKLKLPLISLERSSIAKDPSFKGGFQANIFPDKTGARGYKKHQRLISRRISQKTTRKFASVESDKVSGQENYPTDNKKIVYEEVYAPIPVWVNASYTVRLKAEYQQQMNDLMTPFVSRTGNINVLLAEYDGHRYEVFIESDFAQTNNVANLGEEERMFTAKATVKILGYLTGNSHSDDEPFIQRKESVVDVKISRERVIVGDSKPWDKSGEKFRDL